MGVRAGLPAARGGSACSGKGLWTPSPDLSPWGEGGDARLSDFQEGRVMKALTCNELLTGDVVFWNRGEWVERFAEAEVFTDDAAAAEAEAVATAQGGWAGTAPYLIDLQEGPEGVVPVSYRERCARSAPPTIPSTASRPTAGPISRPWSMLRARRARPAASA